jgi:hypothetical protein
MSVIPLSKQIRDDLVRRMGEYSVGQDPLSYLRQTIFEKNPEHISRIRTISGRPPDAFYLDVVQYCETSAWSEEPPLIISLLRAFEPVQAYPQLVKAVLDEGPFRCHPSMQPYWACLVAANLPLLGRHLTRGAAIRFEQTQGPGKQPGRVLCVAGPSNAGKSYTLKFFEYLAAIQPLQVGVLHFDFGEGDIITVAGNEGILVELYIARRLEEQVRRNRERLAARIGAALPALPGLAGNVLPDLTSVSSQKAHTFKDLIDIPQRTRWAGELAREFVSQVLARAEGVPPRWWVIVFDRCDKIPPLAEEFVRRLVEAAAGAGVGTAEDADKGPLRVVLLGPSAHIMPNPIYEDHVIDEDLSSQAFGVSELKEYFQVFCLSRLIQLDVDPAKHDLHLQQLAEESLKRAAEIVASDPERPSWPSALTDAVVEKTDALTAQAGQKRSGPPQNGGGG